MMSQVRIAIVIVLTLLPWPAVWFGMYKLSSLIWTFFLYHGICLAPAAYWGRHLWMQNVRMPSRKQWLLAIGATLLTSAIAIAAYELSGELIVSRKEVLQVLTLRGFHATRYYLVPLAFYFVFVNATLEELFWRGTVLNVLDDIKQKRTRRYGYFWTAITFAAWHWLVLRALIKPGWAEVAVLGILLMGFFSSWLYRKTDSIILPIIWHAFVFDFAIIAMFAVLVLT
jgi:membrane protease YdiL (CAAX protease family)